MKLTFQLVVSFILVVVAIAVVYGYFEVQRETRQFREDADDEARYIYTMLHERVEAAWRQGGQAGVFELVQMANELQRGMSIRWVSFDADRGSADCPSVSPRRLHSMRIATHATIWSENGTGSTVLHSYWRIPVTPSSPRGLEISRSADALDQKTRTIIVQRIAQVTLTVLVVALVAAVVGIRRVGRPLAQLIEKTRRIGAGDLTGPVQVRSRDELGELASSINQMCTQLLDAQQRIQEETESRIAAVEQLRHADRLRTVGRLAAGLAHELGTPLNVVSGQAEMIAAGELSDAEVKSGAKVIYSEAERMTATIRQLLDFARPSAPQRCDADVAQMVRETASLLESMAKKRNVDLSLSLPAGPLVARIDEGQIRQVLANLMVNAIQAMPQGGTVQIELNKEDAAAPDDPEQPRCPVICLRVSDEGEGIAEKDLGQVFEPFFTTKDIGEGTGLGLSIAHGIVGEHRGWIDVVSQPGRGTCFTVHLPEEADR